MRPWGAANVAHRPPTYLARPPQPRPPPCRGSAMAWTRRCSAPSAPECHRRRTRRCRYRPSPEWPPDTALHSMNKTSPALKDLSRNIPLRAREVGEQRGETLPHSRLAPKRTAPHGSPELNNPILAHEGRQSRTVRSTQPTKEDRFSVSDLRASPRALTVALLLRIVAFAFRRRRDMRAGRIGGGDERQPVGSAAG